jgi:recombination protein RecA
MGSASVKAELLSALRPRFGAYLDFREKPLPQLLLTGLAEVDAVAGGLPRGALTEIFGPPSAGRTSLLHAILASATKAREACALVDASDAFDPLTAEAAGVDLDRLLWIRCGPKPANALKAADLLLQGGGFGLVVLDLGDIAPRQARRVPLTSWFRFRRAVENKPTCLVALEQEPCAQSCSSLVLEMRRLGERWSGAAGCSRLLRGAVVEAERRKPVATAKTPGRQEFVVRSA